MFQQSLTTRNWTLKLLVSHQQNLFNTFTSEKEIFMLGQLYGKNINVHLYILGRLLNMKEILTSMYSAIEGRRVQVWYYMSV